MYLNQFSVRIPEGYERSSGYVELDHNQRYTLVLRNNRGVRCNAQIKIDGNDVGTYRIRANSNIRLERSAINDGYFTFVDIDSREAGYGHLNGLSPDLGLVSVTFTPEVEWEPTGQVKGLESMPLAALSKGPIMRGGRSGGTVSTGHSSQQFTTAGHLVLDYTQQTTINLRLILKEDNQPVVRPLTQKENPVPPRMF